ncbi:hypothetical protein [Curvivirga sp.]|uniref:hypothetical protein n=1 Tax=Curvivirga sp. TaxID=2856848 RepID=UPI003B5C6564
MPYKVDFDGSGMVIIFDGSSDHLDLRKANEDCWEHPNFHKSKYQIWDMSKSSGVLISNEDALITAKFDNAAFGQFRFMKIAIITTDPDIINFTEVYQQHVDADKIQSRIFDTFSDAQRWAQDFNI